MTTYMTYDIWDICVYVPNTKYGLVGYLQNLNGQSCEDELYEYSHVKYNLNIYEDRSIFLKIDGELDFKIINMIKQYCLSSKFAGLSLSEFMNKLNG